MIANSYKRSQRGGGGRGGEGGKGMVGGAGPEVAVVCGGIQRRAAITSKLPTNTVIISTTTSLDRWPGSERDISLDR